MTWRQSQPIAFRPLSGVAPLDTRFPRAIAGEEYDRYARAMWPQAQRWIRKHWFRVTARSMTPQDAQEMLRCVAGMDLARRLYGQEERLITELLQTAWSDLGGKTPDVRVEIPTFLTAERR